MDITTNPFELGLDRLINLDMDADFIGKAALRKIKDAGIQRCQIGVIIDGAPLAQPNTRFWDLSINGSIVGKVTSAVYSPRLEKNIALAMVDSDAAALGTQFTVAATVGERLATAVEKPFYDPKKSIAKGAASASSA
jgi:aminomethyltransferase